ncbi:hypothetical protein H0H93_002670 [Arthromyces matolae]|nr:hypothetical protein H0H93_002670 [Arthromyces matolae]
MTDDRETEPQRTPSIRSVASSVASKSSAASGVSLTRRSRTRTRSRTVTGSSRADSGLNSPTTELPYIDRNFTQEPVPLLLPTQIDAQTLPTRPPRSPRRDTREVAQPLNDNGAGEPLQPEENPHIENLTDEENQSHHSVAKVTRQTSGLQILPSASQPQPPLSAFSRDPELTGVDSQTVNVRDSLSTQVSMQSSSVYPPSNSTASDPDYPPSPQSMTHGIEKFNSYEPVVHDTQILDNDDVAYRLRLLVNNNYFLPPAHSKPSAADFAAMDKTVQKKPSTPTFLQRLRGRSRSKPPTPTSSPGLDPTGPALRTPADSITTAHLRPQPPRASSQFQRGPPPETRTGRVVVVREKMEDIAIAAKQAEHEMKTRALRRDPDSQTGGRALATDVIDPTDAVDLPPPSSDYPFAVQASALRGLGVQESVGAALLADRLPPPQSPDVSSDPEDHWRKALLREAVHHSLDNTPDTSFSNHQGTSTPLASSALRVPVRSMPLIDQRIVNNARLSNNSAISRKMSSQSLSSSASRSRSILPGSSTASLNDLPTGVVPLRSTTPSSPLTPLAPAPRRHVVNLSNSTSNSDLEHRAQLTENRPRTSVRRTISSPSLSESYADCRSLAQTPPPLPTPTMSVESFSEQQSGSRVTSQWFGTEPDVDEDGAPRRSFAMSAIEGRPSLSISEYSQPSPTMSAFCNGPSTMNGDTLNQAQWQRIADHEVASTSESPVPRYSAMSPPPRISSSLAHFALSPPPRSSSLNYQVRSAPSPRLSTSTDPQQASAWIDTNSIEDTTMVINEPAPTTPTTTTVFTPRHAHSNGISLSLEIPPTDIAVAIHSAPGPSSPTSFFDSIQSQPNAMDDLDSSDESDDDADATPSDTVGADPHGPTSRPSLMRLGNHSTPYFSPASGVAPRPSTGIKTHQPIGNIAVRAPFFREAAAKHDHVNGPPVSSFDFYKYANKNRPSDFTAQRRSTVGNLPAWKASTPKVQESMKKLDELLIQHVETEKDTIKRIAATPRMNGNIPLERGF